MNVRSLLSIGLTIASLTACSQVPTTLAAQRDAGVRLEIVLRHSAAFTSAHGKAKYQNRGGEREFEVEVEDVRRLQGQTLGIFINGSRVGGARVNSLGEARLERNSDLGQAVPAVRPGTSVKVKTASGTLVVSGSF